MIGRGRWGLLLWDCLLGRRRGAAASEFLEDCYAHAEVDEAAEEEVEAIFPSHYIMGCEVTSAYNDEVVGKMGFTQPIVDDMLARDFRKAATMSELELKDIAVLNI
jgi:hypothetical protein